MNRDQRQKTSNYSKDKILQTKLESESIKADFFWHFEPLTSYISLKSILPLPGGIDALSSLEKTITY